jgi:uncharacterized protein YciI
MYAIALIRYRRPLEEVLAVTERHRAYLKTLKDAGTLIASGPLEPRTGGALLLRVPDDAVDATLDAIRDGDPYVTFGVAQYEVIPWAVGTGQSTVMHLWLGSVKDRCAISACDVRTVDPDTRAFGAPAG